MFKRKNIVAVVVTLFVLSGLGGIAYFMSFRDYQESGQMYFPVEEEKHEGTWLTWPHPHTYGKTYSEKIEPIWIQMAKSLSTGEKVHIIAYDNVLKNRIEQN